MITFQATLKFVFFFFVLLWSLIMFYIWFLFLYNFFQSGPYNSYFCFSLYHLLTYSRWWVGFKVTISLDVNLDKLSLTKSIKKCVYPNTSIWNKLSNANTLRFLMLSICEETKNAEAKLLASTGLGSNLCL